jgi:hypothetical protein
VTGARPSVTAFISTDQEVTMSVRRISYAVSVASIVLAPALGIVAAVATPALVSSSTRDQLVAVSQHQDRFYVYCLFVLLSSYLFVPAIAGVRRLMPDSRPAWTEIAYLVTQMSMLIALGDAATEMVWWQAGSPHASQSQMVALSDRLDAAPGYALIYTIGGLGGMLGIAVLAAALIRTHSAPAWAALTLPVGFVVNIAGFTIANQTVLVASYLVLTVGMVRLAALVRSPDATRVRVGALVSPELGGQSAG